MKRKKIVAYNNMKKFRLIVLDIDETLFTSIDPEDYKSVSHKEDYKLEHGKRPYKAFRRPFLKKFIEFCLKQFDYIGIWTNADEMWMRKFIDNLLPNTPFLFTYDKSYSEEYVHNGVRIRIKPLRKIFEKYAHLGIDSTNTIMIEDSPENCIQNKKNCIQVPDFNVVKNSNDYVLPLLAAYIYNMDPSKDIKKQNRPNWLQYIKKKYKIK